jgi:hypothetical protein
MDLVSLQKQSLIKLGPTLIIKLSDQILRRWRYRFGITETQVRAWASDTASSSESVPCKTPRQVCQKAWRELNDRWTSSLGSGMFSVMVEVVMDLLVFDGTASVMPKIKRTKHSKSHRAERNERRRDILNRAYEKDPIIEPYLDAVKDFMGRQRGARTTIKPRASKRSIVQMLRGRPDELRRVLALRRARRVVPMPLP